MKRFLLSVCLTLAVMLVWAKPVSLQTAQKVAINFANSQNIPVNDNDVVNISLENVFDQFYIFKFNGYKGFVIVAADDRVLPILGYSTKTLFPSGDMPKHVYEWFDDYEKQIDFYVANNVEPTAEVQQEWDNLLDSDKPSYATATAIVDALVQTQWNQSPYYNDQCPVYSGTNKSVTGCVATAMAQVMKFWNHPATGVGSHSYTWNSQTLSANFANTTYDWTNMPNSLSSYSSTTQVNAVATLMYHVGVALEMDYGASSGAYTYCEGSLYASAETALQEYFKYSNNIRNISYADVTDAEWKTILKNELNDGRPMLYSGRDPSGGHCFVCDGYDSRNYFHINWGWGGGYDAFYAIGDLHPGSGGTGGNSTYTFNLRNAVVLGIEPITGTLPSQTVITAVPDNTTHGSVSGSGTYNYGTVATLTATPADAYLFGKWDDNDLSNPRYVYATSSAFNRTAYFTSLPTDTLHYCNNTCASSYGYSSGSYTQNWGFRYPATALQSGRIISKVQFYPTETGQYTVKIYQGDNSQMTLAYSEQFSTSVTDSWVDFQLSTPYSINNAKSLWVTLEYTGTGYPKSYTSLNTGNNNGAMYLSGSSWTVFSYLKGGSWLIKAVTESASCATPNGLTASNVTASQAQISWTPGYQETAWNLQYKASSASTWTTVNGVTSPYTLTGLSSNTLYDVRVQSDCDSEQSSWTAPLSFRTSVVPDQLPFVTGFENVAQNNGWIAVNGSSASNLFMIGTDANAVASGSNALYMSNNGAYGYDITSSTKTYIYRTLQFTPGVYTVSFNWKCTGGEGNYDFGRVMLVPDSVQLAGSTGASYSNTVFPNALFNFIEKMNLTSGDDNGWNTYYAEIDMTNNAGIYNLVIMWSNDASAGTQYPIAIDDISIRALSCPRPQNVTVSNVTENQAQISWTSGTDVSAVILQYKTSSDNTWNTINGVTSPYILTGLASTSFYDVRLQSDCGTEQSDWSEQLSFRTTGAPLQLPFTADFESTQDAAKWEFGDNGKDNAFVVGNAISNGGSRSLYLSNDGGSYNYTSNTCQAYARVLLSMKAGEYIVSYDYRCTGEPAAYDYGRIFLYPSAYEFGCVSALSTTTPTGNLTVSPVTILSVSSWTHAQYVVTVPADGFYYFQVNWRDDSSVSKTYGLAIDNVSIASSNPCDETSILIEESHSMCQGSTYSWHGRSLTEPGIYYDSLQTVEYGCDSVHKLTLTTFPRYYDVTIVLKDSVTHITGEYGVYPDLSMYETPIVRCDSVFTFVQWSPAVTVQDTMPVTYHAIYNATATYYNVTWEDWDNTTLYVEALRYDSLITPPADPTRPADASNVYFFSGWTPYYYNGMTMTCHDLVFKATYTAAPRFYTDTLVRMNDTVYVVAEYDSTPDFSLYQNTIENCDSIYYFSHWTPAVAVQDTFNVSYTAVYTKTAKSPLLFEEYDTITQGDTYTWHGRDLTEAGVYYDSLQTALGCDSVFQLTLTVNPFVCVAPTNLVATLISNKSFQFDWVNPTLGTENEQPNYFTYVLSATELDDPSAVKPTKAQRTTTMAQLTAALYDTEYHFYVKNVCRGVSSDWAHVAISSISGRPAVDSLHVVDTETQAITLSWKRNRFGKELKWKVDVALASDSSEVKSLVASTTGIRVTGLDASTEYIFTVSPRLNSTNFGDAATVNGTTLDKPAMPVNVYGEITANRQITFYWQNGSEADANNFSYKLSSKYIDMNKDKYSDNPDVEDFADTTVAFNNLSYGTTYYFYVRNVRADGAASDWALCYVKTNLQNPPVKNIHAEDATPTTLTVAWERGNAASAEPRWIVVMRRESDNELIDSVNVGEMNCTFTGLTRGTDYVVKVYPRLNSTTLGTPASVVLSTEQTCEAPINLTYVNDAYRAYTFSWENPTIGTTEVEPNNFTYVLRQTNEPFNPDTVYATGRNLTATSLSVTKLSKGAIYYFYVRNEYDGAVSAWAGPIVIEVPATASAGAHYETLYENENENENENFVVAEAYVNSDKLFVENIVEGSDVMVIDASGRVVYSEKVDDTRMECELFVRGVYVVVIRGKLEQTIKVVY